MPAEVADELPESVSMALFNALIPDKDKRLQTVEELRVALTAEPAVNALIDDAKEDEENAVPTEAKKANRYPLYIGISVFVVMAILAAILLCILFPGNNTPLSDETVTTTTLPSKATTVLVDDESDFAIPDLMNKNYFTEKHATYAGDFVIEVDYMKFDKKKAKGTILSQTPAAGTSAKEGSTIKVVISMGSEELTVPNVSGWPKEYATEYLEALGFRVEVLLLNVSEYDKGTVEETEPAAKTVLGVGDTVTLRVSDVEQTEETEGTEEAPEVTE